MTWRGSSSRLYHARSNRSDKVLPEFSGFVLLAVALLGFYCVLMPHRAGVAGAMLARALTRAFGQSVYLLWALMGYRGLRLLLNKEKRRPWRYVLVDGLLVVAVAGALTALGEIFLDVNPGGYAGKGSTALLKSLFGRWGALFTSITVVVGLTLWRAGQRPRDLLQWIGERLANDWAEWRQARADQRARASAPPKRKPLPRLRRAEEKSPLSGSGSLPKIPTVPEMPPLTAKAAPEPPLIAAKDPPPRRSFSEKPPSDAALGISPKSPSDTDEASSAPYQKPLISLLTVPERAPQRRGEEELLANAQLLEKTLADFGVQGKVVEIHPGPIITRFDYSPAPGIKVQSIANLSNDIAMAMRALSVRILAPIPGKAAVGIELPNPKRALVRIREILESPAFETHPSKLVIGLGKDAEGQPYVADLASMPHLLIAGSTGSGKSVCIHAIMMSILFRATPAEVKLLLIDPKRLELPLYNGIPHLYDPNQNPESVRVITDSKEASKALEGVVRLMDHRFKKFASVMARDISHYNSKMAADGRPPEAYIVVIIDELADLMAVAPKEVEGSIQRLTQMARAVGIHLVLATQRPSVDVITGVIKANLPARLAFRVSSQTDSRVILDGQGAESLLGEGDLLFLPPGAPKPIRLQCGFVSSREVQAVADYVRSQGTPSYDRLLTPITADRGEGGGSTNENPEEEDLRQALMLVLERRRVSQDLLKAHFGSSARATNLLSLLEVKGFISKPEGTNRWTIHYERIDAYLTQIKNGTPVS